MSFRPGQSGNPGGRPKGLTKFREALEAANTPELLVKVLKRGLENSDVEIALEAFDRAAAYLYGRPERMESEGNTMNVAILPNPMDHHAARIAMGLEPRQLTQPDDDTDVISEVS